MSMDFAAMGTMMGAQGAIANVRNNARESIAERDEAIAERDVLISERDGIIGQYRAALLTSYARDAALLAEVRALKAALLKVDSTNSLLRKTGRRYKSGAEETALTRLYDDAFDQGARKYDVTNPERLRDSV